MDDSQLLRYSRQILLPQIDVDGQERLMASTVLIVGLGGLGSPAAMYLAAAGVGRLLLNDFDQVDLSNLQRQIMHSVRSLGELKTRSARMTLELLNPDTQLCLLEGVLEGDALLRAVADADVVLDCSDNLTTRFAVNAACVSMGKPLVSGAVIRFEGQLAVYTPGQHDSPCYNCLYEGVGELPETCNQTGVIAPLPGIIGSMQALEAIKLLIGAGPDQAGWVSFFDAWVFEWRRIRLSRNPACPTCGTTHELTREIA